MKETGKYGLKEIEIVFQSNREIIFSKKFYSLCVKSQQGVTGYVAHVN